MEWTKSISELPKEGEVVIIYPTKRMAYYIDGEFMVDVEGNLRQFGWPVTFWLRIEDPF